MPMYTTMPNEPRFEFWSLFFLAILLDVAGQN